jgi:hypothetical protein
MMHVFLVIGSLALAFQLRQLFATNLSRCLPLHTAQPMLLGGIPPRFYVLLVTKYCSLRTWNPEKLLSTRKTDALCQNCTTRAANNLLAGWVKSESCQTLDSDMEDRSQKASRCVCSSSRPLSSILSNTGYLLISALSQQPVQEIREESQRAWEGEYISSLLTYCSSIFSSLLYN